MKRLIFATMIAASLAASPVAASGGLAFQNMCMARDLTLESAHTVREILRRTISDDCQIASEWLMRQTMFAVIDAGIQDLTPLSGLVRLTDLDLIHNRVFDLGPLVTLINLQTLDVSQNRVVDIAPLATMTSLECLYLSGNGIVDVSPLASLTQLHILELDGNPVIPDEKHCPVGTPNRLLNVFCARLRNIPI